MSQAKKFASQADLEEKKVTFSQISEHAWAYTAEGDPNTGIIIGDDAVLVADTQATPAMAADVIRRIREVTDKPIKYVVLTHYHAVRVLGASAYQPQQILASQDTYDLIVERGEQDKASEIGRFPRLFQQRRDRAAGHDLADDDLHRQDDAVAGQARSAAAAARPRPHQGRHRRLAAAGAHAAVAATWSSSTPRPMPATPTSRTGRRRSTTSPRSSRRRWCPAAAPALHDAGAGREGPGWHARLHRRRVRQRRRPARPRART